jgi:hypothetical protein
MTIDKCEAGAQGAIEHHTPHHGGEHLRHALPSLTNVAESGIADPRRPARLGRALFRLPFALDRCGAAD